MIQTIGIPSYLNITNLVAKRLQPFNSERAPFEFLEEDQNGNETPYDITPYTFTLNIFNGGRFETSYTSFVIDGINKLYLDISSVDIDAGVYDYEIVQDGYNSIIKGKFKVLDNGE